MKLHAVFVAFLATALVSSAPAQDPVDPLVLIKSQVKDHTKSFGLIVEMTIKAESEAAFRELARVAVEATRMEPGNSVYEIQRDAADPTKFFFIERWKNIAALEEHMAKDYVKNLLAKLPEFSAGPPVIHVTHSYLFARTRRPAPRPEGGRKPAVETKPAPETTPAKP